MRTIQYKWFWAWEFEKEEQWLNQQAAKGQCLLSVAFCRYEFAPCQPGEYNIRLELLDELPSHTDSQHYIAFVEDTGAEHIGSVTRWVYFRKKTQDGPFALFSDYSSRIKHFNRILLLLGIVGGLNLYIGLNNLWLYFAMQNAINLMGLLNLCLGTIVLLGFYKIQRQKGTLQKEQQIFE